MSLCQRISWCPFCDTLGHLNATVKCQFCDKLGQCHCVSFVTHLVTMLNVSTFYTFGHLKVMLICKEESTSLYKDIDDVMVNCRFATMYCDRAQTALPYAMNSEFSKVLAGQMVSSNGCSLHYWFIYNSEFLIFNLAVDLKRDCKNS